MAILDEEEQVRKEFTEIKEEIKLVVFTQEWNINIVERTAYRLSK